MIELSNVSFGYGDNAMILENLNLKIEDGEIVLLCGESGCGKSTVLRLINGLIPNYYGGELKGRITVNGYDTQNSELYQIAEQVSSVFQNPKTQFYNIESTEEMVFSLENRGVNREEMGKRLGVTVKKLGMEGLLDRSLFEMSGGERQKVACACADTAGTPVIVLDEPSSNLDLGSIDELAKIIAQWKKDGKTVIVAEHRLYYMIPLADRVLYMKNGKVEMECKPEKLIALGETTISQMGLRSAKRHDIEVKRNDGEAFEQESGSLHIKDFSYKYRGCKEPALRIDDLTVPSNRIICVVGDNGAGKSTFARTICGLDRHAKGVIEYNNKCLKRKDRLKNTFMVMQDVTRQLFTDEVSDELRSCVEEEAEDSESRILSLLEHLNLSDKKERHPQSLSGGEKQRVAIGSAMVSSREFIVFDEPTSGLDYKNMVRVARLLKELKKHGKTIFVITHDPELISLCCDVFINIKDGTAV
ncbi:MAG: energy-coupling factor ABC transporter ATP-binding protein [Lachnospiraceae bacterium]|nr:energy-coupling factor ABC transporter ATP-binding protein [Lachnospiraceae bacterium]